LGNFFPLNEKEFFGDKENLKKEADLISNINDDDVWEDSPQKTKNDKRLKRK